MDISTDIPTNILNTFTEDYGNNEEIWDHEISFEIPSNFDFEKITNFDQNFTSFLDISGSSVIDVNSISSNSDIISENSAGNSNGIFDKLSNSDFDYHTILNFLWIGVVTTLIVLSIVFIVFSCYFYRKFREWKKCNKDIRSQLPNDLYSSSQRFEDRYQQQIELPPCYTIATGLPSYDEAILNPNFILEMGFHCSYKNKNNKNIEENSFVIKEAENENFVKSFVNDNQEFKEYPEVIIS